MNTTAATRIMFDALNFVKRLEAVGVKPEIAKVQVQLQVESQVQVLEKQEEAQQQFIDKFNEYSPLLDEIKITKNEFATKGDILAVKEDILALESRMDKTDAKIDILNNKFTGKFDVLDGKIDSLYHKLIVRLSGIVVASTATLGVVMALINHA